MKGSFGYSILYAKHTHTHTVTFNIYLTYMNIQFAIRSLNFTVALAVNKTKSRKVGKNSNKNNIVLTHESKDIKLISHMELWNEDPNPSFITRIKLFNNPFTMPFCFLTLNLTYTRKIVDNYKSKDDKHLTIDSFV